MVKNLISISFVCLCYNLNAQTSNSQLLYQHFGVNENQSELNYISRLLEANNLTIAGPNQEKAITEAHNFYLSHKEEIDMNLKAEELVLFRSIVKKATKEAKAAAWTQALESFVTNFSGALSAAQQQQNIDLQKKLNKEIEIQSVLARHSISTPKQYTQNFGSIPVETTTPKSTRVTTSNGLDEPLPSAQNNNSDNSSMSKDINKTDNFNTATTAENSEIIPAVYVYGKKLVACKLSLTFGRIIGYSVSKDALGRDDFKPIYPTSPSKTMQLLDGDFSSDYKYKVSGDGKTFYFNM